LFFLGCRKETVETFEQKPVENISAKEVQDWFTIYKQTIPNAPDPVWIKATKTFYNKQMIVRVPLSSGGGEMVFSKNKTLEVKFFRRVSSTDTIAKRFSGYYESIDISSYAYHKVNYVEGIKGKEFRSQSVEPPKATKGTIRSSSEYYGSWFGALLHCIGSYIFAIPKRQSGGGWDCYVPGTTEQSVLPSIDPYEGGVGGYVNLHNLFPILFNPNTPPVYISPIDWTAFWGGGSVIGMPGHNPVANYSPPYVAGEVDPDYYLNSIDAYNKSKIEEYYNSIDHYWERSSYDNIFPPYDPNRDGQRDSDGYRKNGNIYHYVDGEVQNYTDDNGGKYAVFTKSNGEIIKFPSATITDFGVLDRSGVTTPNGGIRMSTNQNGLEDLQHEYGHFLHANIIGSAAYFSKVVPSSLYSAFLSTFTGTSHQSNWTEKIANNLSAAYFGPNSDIAKSSFYQK